MANKTKYKIQSLIFDRRYYKSIRQIKNWIKNNGEYKLLKYKRKPIMKLDFVFQVCQRETRYFKKSTFKRKKLNKSGTIQLVIGKLK